MERTFWKRAVDRVVPFLANVYSSSWIGRISFEWWVILTIAVMVVWL